MRILCISVVFPPEWSSGGTTATAYYSSSSLISLGNEVLAITTCADKAAGLPPLDQQTYWNGVPVIYCRRRSGTLPYPFYSATLSKTVLEYARTSQVATIRSSWTFVGPVASHECRRANLPYIAYPEGCLSPWALRQSAFKKRLFWQLCEKSFFAGANTIVALTKFEADCIRKMGLRNPIEVIPNGVHIVQHSINGGRGKLEEMYPSLKDRQWVTFLGRLHPVKGLPNLIKAYESVVSNFRDTVLVIAGPDTKGYELQLKKQVDRLGLHNQVSFLGALQGDLKHSLLENSIVFVLPSYTEGFSVALLEAMSFGVPSIYSSGCHLPELAQFGAGIEVDPAPRNLAFALESLLSDSAARAQMGEIGRSIVSEQYTWQKIAQQTQDLCQALVH